jgi:hypothetical protein
MISEAIAINDDGIFLESYLVKLALFACEHLLFIVSLSLAGDTWRCCFGHAQLSPLIPT